MLFVLYRIPVIKKQSLEKMNYKALAGKTKYIDKTRLSEKFKKGFIGK